MRGWVIRLVVVLVAVLAVPAAAHAEGRVALVVGNAAYNAEVGPLANPVRDAGLIADALAAKRFAVTRATNLDRVQLLAAVDAYARRLAAAGPGAVGFIYYSGHGAANPDTGRNFLIPVDARSAADSGLWYQSVPLEEIVETVSRIAPQAANVVVFDACREALRLPGGKGLGSGGKGLHRELARPSVLIAFSTSPDAIAADLDRTAATGPYATELAAALARPGVDLEAMFSDVKYGVLSRTGQKQLPYIENGLRERVVLDGVVRPAGPGGDPADDDARDWANAFRINSRAAFAAYLARRPTGLFAGEAQRRIAAFDQPAPQVSGGPSLAQLNQTLHQDAYARWGLTESDFRLLDARPLLAKAGGAARFAEWEKAAADGDPVALTLTGMGHDWGVGAKQDSVEALRWYRKAADLGQPQASRYIAFIYRDGDGVPVDRAEGLRWFRRGAELGDPVAMNDVGFAYYTGAGVARDYGEAVRWYRKAADLGNALAMKNLGYMYDAGQGVPQDFAEAMRWYRKAADLGQAGAMTNIGALYDNGQGVARNYAEAARWYREAADRGNALGMKNLGFLYESGHGVTQDYAEALRLYRKAADLNEPIAMKNLGLLYENGRGTAQDYAEAMRWYRKAADLGLSGAMTNVGFLYDRGFGVPKDPDEALRWYRKAAELNEPVAISNIGIRYDFGQGVAQDHAEAVRWYRRAADLGNVIAMKNLGLSYRDGEGIGKDFAEARRWLEKAAAAGDEDAKKAVAQLAAAGH